MRQFKVHILAADRVMYEGPCESLVIPTPRGQYGILGGHFNMITAVVPGKLTYRVPDSEARPMAVSAGLVKVEDNDVMVLVDTAEYPEEIDANRARRAAERAKEEILQKQSIREYYAAQANLARAINRLKVKGNHNPK